MLELPFADSFDMVFSHGVLHHVPEIKQAEKEISRVLRPGGELVIMMYARWSLNYLVSIALVRRALLLGAFPLSRMGIVKSGREGGMLAAHLDNAKKLGMGPLPSSAEVHALQPERPSNPLRPGVTLDGSRRDFRLFGSAAPTSATCTRRRSPFTDCPARPCLAGIYGRT